MIPQLPRKISRNVPPIIPSAGKPSNIKLIILPNASPNIVKIFTSVAPFHKEGVTTPDNQNNPNPKYNPIIALKALLKSLFPVLRSAKAGIIFSGKNPYITAIPKISNADTLKCRFLKRF